MKIKANSTQTLLTINTILHRYIFCIIANFSFSNFLYLDYQQFGDKRVSWKMLETLFRNCVLLPAYRTSNRVAWLVVFKPPFKARKTKCMNTRQYLMIVIYIGTNGAFFFLWCLLFAYLFLLPLPFCSLKYTRTLKAICCKEATSNSLNFMNTSVV